MEIPSEAIEALDRATARSKRRSSVNFPITYVKRGDGIATAARLVQSNEVRLKLHMTFMMQATAPPYSLPDRPSRSLARWLNLPSATGSRRANDAKKWLLTHNLIAAKPLDDGRPGLVLLHPDGSGDEWTGPAERWVGLPIQLWSNYWILRLSGRAIAVLLALTELNGGSRHQSGALMDGHRKKQYGLSDDTWTRATQELAHFGLITITPVHWGDDDHQIRRRNRYRVNRNAFENAPDWADDWRPKGRSPAGV